MADHTSRRSLLALAGLAVTAAHVPPAISKEAAPDAGLLALGLDLDEVGRLCDEAFAHLDVAEEQAPYRPEPESLIATGWDMGNALPMPAALHDVRGRTWTRAQIEEIRSRAPRREDTVLARRRGEILAAYDAHSAQVSADEEALGIPALTAAYQALEERRRGIAIRIVGTPAVGISGLQVKARAMVALYGALPAISTGDADSVKAWKSIVVDLIAMGGAA